MLTPSVLVFAEAWYPGWRVYVNGGEQPLLRANYVFQGGHLPAAGRYEVVFEYTPPLYVWIGRVISGLTLLLALAVLCRRK
jgi:uncharacterized membrane protein YfhO